MAVTMAYGVMFGTLFILLFYPVLIIILNNIRYYNRILWLRYLKWYHGELPEGMSESVTRESVEPAVKQMKITID
jgi:hypothetical protein